MVKFHTIQAVEECRRLKDEKHIMGLIYLRTDSAQNIHWSPCTYRYWRLALWVLSIMWPKCLLKSTTILMSQMINVYFIQHSNNYRLFLILTPIYTGVEFNFLQTID